LSANAEEIDRLERAFGEAVLRAMKAQAEALAVAVELMQAYRKDRTAA